MLNSHDQTACKSTTNIRLQWFQSIKMKTFNEIPVAPSSPPAPQRMTAEETLREKLKLLRQLEELEKKGIKFKSKNSDTEVLLKLYKYKKFKMLEDLNGMFSFVIYDKIKNILFIIISKGNQEN